MRRLIATVMLASIGAFPAYAAGTIPIVAAENFYGDTAKTVGGDHVYVTSILSNPDEDPHLFEVNPSVARNLAAAKVVIYNGADYDP
jgi:zinc/manganese transport system substrate-binding protein